MKSQGSRVVMHHHRTLWTRISSWLPFFVGILFIFGFLNRTIPAAELANLLQSEIAGLTHLNKDGGADSPSQGKQHLILLPVSSEGTDDGSDAPEDGDDCADREYKPDSESAATFNAAIAVTVNRAQAIYFAYAKWMQKRKTRPLFLLHRSWKSFLC